jgi:hypothetical protein
VLEALEWLAESANRAKVTVAEAVRKIDEATARQADGPASLKQPSPQSIERCMTWSP